MNAFSIAINESQWMFCLLQVSGLILVGLIIGRVVLRRFPDLTATIGVVVLATSAGLIVLTWFDIPRPFELSTNNHKVAEAKAESSSNLSGSGSKTAKLKSDPRSGSWINQLVSFVDLSNPSNNSMVDSKNHRQFWTRHVILLLLLTSLGGLVFSLRIAHSSLAILILARKSYPVDDLYIKSEVAKISAKLPTRFRHPDIAVWKYSGPGSPFVSWLTGRKIFVPEEFLNWSASEQSASLAHEISHLQRRDHYCRLITQLAFCLNWLHPLAWLLHRQTVLAQELAADQLAAQLFDNSSAYCRGLSRLALRFDTECRQPSAIGVSISSSLIRRITMLREINFDRLPCSRFVNRCVSFTALVACSWVGCWTVEGQTNQEKTADSKVVTASHTTPVKMFSQPTAQPWDSIGNQSGYLQVQLKRILGHPDLTPYVPMMTAAIDGLFATETDATPSIKIGQFGLGLKDIAQVQSGVSVSIKHDPNQPDGHRSSLSFGVASTEITAVNEVDWPRLIKAVDFTKAIFSSIPQGDIDRMQEAWLRSSRKSHSNLFQAMGPLASPNTKPPSATKKVVWNAVSGGCATVVYDIIQSGEVPQDYKESDAVNQANLDMTTATEIAAWGFDFSQDYKTCQIRFAAVPTAKTSTDELLAKFEALKGALAKSAKDSEEGLVRHFIEQIQDAKVTVVPGKTVNGESTKDYLFIEGQCKAELLKRGFTQSVVGQ